MLFELVHSPWAMVWLSFIIVISYLCAYCSLSMGGDCWRLHENHINAKEATGPLWVCDRREIILVIDLKVLSSRTLCSMKTDQACCWFIIMPHVCSHVVLHAFSLTVTRQQWYSFSQQNKAPVSVDTLISPSVSYYWWCHIRSHRVSVFTQEGHEGLFNCGTPFYF